MRRVSVPKQQMQKAGEILPMRTFRIRYRNQELKHRLYRTQEVRLEDRLSVNVYEHYLRKNFRSTELSLPLAVFSTLILAYFVSNFKKESVCSIWFVLSKVSQEGGSDCMSSMGLLWVVKLTFIL